jgi:dimethylargininase
MMGPMTAPLRRVLVRPPDPATFSRWREYGWRAAPDPGRIAAEHEALQGALAEAGARVVVADGAVEANPDAVYVFDPVLVTPLGAVLLRPGKAARRNEVEPLGNELERARVPIIGQLEPPACAEGGDTLWLDHRTLVVGLGYRTNEAGAAALARLLPGVEVLAVDLPHFRGPRDLLHLMSVVSPLDDDLALVHLPLMPVRLVRLLTEHGVRFVGVAPEELDTKGCNVLAVGPRKVIAVDGNDATRRRLEAAGVEVATYPREELAGKGYGGPTCLTLPLDRG